MSRDGARVVTGSSERGLAVWDAQSWRQLRRLETSARIRAISLLGSGERAVVSSPERVCVWDLAGGKQLSCSPGFDGGDSPAVAPSEEQVAWPVKWPEEQFIRVWKIPQSLPRK